MKKLRRRAILLFFTLFATLSVGISIIFANTFEDQQINQYAGSLSRQLETLTSQLNGEYQTSEEVTSFIPALESAAGSVSERITLMDSQGLIVYDTHYNDTVGSDVSAQGEVSGVMNSQEITTDLRNDATTNTQLIFAAIPLYSQSREVMGYLRIARPIQELTDSMSTIYGFVIVLCLVATLIATIFFYYWTQRITEPIQAMKNVVQDLSDKNYNARYRTMGKESYEEVNEMGKVINKLAESLQTQLIELRQGNERLNSLIQNLSVGVMLLDSDRNIQLVNPAMMETLEINIETGNSYIQFIKNPWLVQLVEDAYEKAEIQVGELNLQTGEEHLIDATTIPINSNDEINIIILLYDVTEVNRLEKVRTDFVTNASHELRTPVTAVKGFTETLLDGAMDDRETLEKFLNIILKETKRLDYLVGDILQLSKLEDRNMQIELETFDVKEPTLEVVEILKQKAEAKSIEVSIEVIKPTTITSDFDLLKQILLNLINNAILYTQEKGKVDVVIDHDDTDILIKIRDNGMGIPKNEQDRVFERFYRLDKARSRNVGGTGLGLSIVKHIVENLEGTLHLESQIGLGSEFTISIPRKDINKIG